MNRASIQNKTLAIAIYVASFVGGVRTSISQDRLDSVPNRIAESVPSVSHESTKLPKVPSVERMISPQRDVEGIFQRSAVASAFDSSEKLIDYGMRTTLNPDSEDAVWGDSVYTWAAPNFYSQPLYFEQVNFERYDSKIAPCLQPAVSYAQFLGTIPVLPYKIGGQPIHSRAYSLGHWRPGNCTTHQIHWGPCTTRGLVYQGVAATGAVFFFP